MTSHGTHWAAFAGPDADRAAIDALAEASTERTLKRSQFLIEQADAADQVFLIIEGVCSAVKYTRNGHEIWLADFESGALVGEIAVLAGSRRTSAVIASTKVRALGVHREDFEKAMATDPGFSTAVARLLATRTSETSNQLASMIGASVSARLHFELLKLATPKPDDSEVFQILGPPTVSALGRRIHATREATSRALTELEKRGLAIRGDGWLEVIAPQGYSE